MSDRFDPVRRLQLEAEVARILLANMRDVLADDAEGAALAIESETNLLEAMAAAAQRIGELEAMQTGIAGYLKTLSERKARCERREELLRAALCVAVGQYAEITGQRKVELACGTISLTRTQPDLIIESEADIPTDYFRPQPPKLDRAALKKALKEQSVPGARLDNGGETIQIRR